MLGGRETRRLSCSERNGRFGVNCSLNSIHGLGAPGDIPMTDGVGVTALDAFKLSYVAEVKLRVSSAMSDTTCHKVVSRVDFLRNF